MDKLIDDMEKWWLQLLYKLKCMIFTNTFTVKVNGIKFRMISVISHPHFYHQIRRFCYLQETTVTQKLWTHVMGQKPDCSPKGENYPVVNVSWYQAWEFTSKLSQATGICFRLPSVDEWDGAAGYDFYSPSQIKRMAWYNCNELHEVATKSPNYMGFYDLLGNVWEWCKNKDYYKSELRVRVGGSYRMAEVGHTISTPPEGMLMDVGFRVACDASAHRPFTDNFRKLFSAIIDEIR